MEIEVNISSSFLTEVGLDSVVETEVITNVANKLTDLIDVNSSGINTTSFNYVLVYDAPSNEFKFVDPDDVLVSAAATTGQTSSPGLPGAFINALDSNPNRVDNIDFDGGSLV